MSAIAKTLIENKEWIVQYEHKKVGTIHKVKKGYVFNRNNNRIYFKDMIELQENLGVKDLGTKVIKSKSINTGLLNIYDYPCKTIPHNAIYNLKKKLPIYTKNKKSKCYFCAGYYVIKSKNNWFKSFCPKFITLDRYQYYGPFKTEEEAKNLLNTLNQNEAT